MVDILHRVATRTSNPHAAYEAITTLDGLAGWWTEKTTGETEVGGRVEFRFPNGGFDMEVVDAAPGQSVTWKVVDGPDEWVGTTVEWSLRQDGDYTVILFAHRGWREPVEFMHHCSTKWATFLISLKSLVETGQGAPSPRDVPIDDWD